MEQLTQSDSDVISSLEAFNLAHKEGYLLRRNHKILRIWIRKWYILDADKIFYTSKRSDKFITATTLVEDIRLCNVRRVEHTDRKYVFKVNSIRGQHLFQAESHADRESWIRAINQSISQSLKGSTLSTFSVLSSQTSDGNASMLSCDSICLKLNMIGDRKQRVLEKDGNETCADCGSSRPNWASVNLGILLCMHCSSVHRSLGVAISRVRSIYMDDWDLETLIMMADLGNTALNNILECRCVDGKPCPNGSISSRTEFIRNKYKYHKYICDDNLTSEESRNKMLLRSVTSDPPDVQMALRAIVGGANVNVQNASGETALIIAIQKHSISMIELLILNNASTEVSDYNGASPLHHAVMQSFAFRSQITSLIKRNAACNLLDVNGFSPLDYALNQKDPDVVTWLRLVNLHSELEQDDPNVEKSFLCFLEDPAYLLEMASMFPI